MKTKISHLGRSTVSVILAVMMLLSTMLIGTVSTVNAVTKTFEAVNLVGNINGNTKWDSTKYPFTFDETTGYWYLDITITQSSEFKARVNKDWVISFGASGGGNYIISEIGDYRISVKDGAENGTELTVQKTVKKVADSVTLTANPTSVKVGNSVTLTPTVSGAKSDNLTYTYKKTSDGTATEEKNADNSLTVTPTVAGTYKYTVTVSADGCSPVTSNEVSFTVTDSVKYYICGRFNNKWHDPLANDPQFVEDESNPGLFYYETNETIAQLSGTISETYNNTTSDYPRYFYINKAATKDNNYLTTSDSAGHNFQNNTDDRKLALSSQSGTDEKFLVRFNDVNNTSKTPVTIWLDTRNNENNEYKLWYTTALPHKVNVAEGVSATVDRATATAGETVTVTATSIPQGQILDTVTVKGEDNKPVITTVSGNTATFTMPDQNVTVTNVTFRTANTYTVTFRSSDETSGSVSAKYNGTDFTSGAKVTEGGTVTFTAEPENGYALSGWTLNDASVSPTTNPYTITVQKDTTVVANFKEMTGTLSGYYLLCGTDATFKAGSYTPVPLYTNEEGVYYADFNAADITKNKDYFIIFSTKEDTSGIIVDNNNVTINAVNNNGFSLSNHNENVQNPNGGSNNVKFAKVYINKDEVSGFTIKITNLDVNSKKITYSAEPKFKEAPKNAVNIIAKNGTQTEKFQSMGTTVITPVDKVVFDIGKYNDNTQKATAIKGNKVTVTTTVDKDYKDTYYVKGFVVNGESYGIQSGPNDDGVYTLEYQIPDDVVDGTNFEITPVYFLKDSSNCVTFYVEGFDGAVQESWGNTIACYPYYEGVDKNSTNKNAFGAYPGQPLLYEGGKYYTQIPKSITLNGTDKKIVGMTLNNFTLELVHGAISTIKENKQSYDYDDFVRIANNNYGNNIIYTFKYSTVKDNFGENIVSDATITKADFASPTGNGWEDLTDYNHRKVDLFGNVLTGTDSEKEPLLVVSNGYFENYQGFYATEWTVYKKT